MTDALNDMRSFAALCNGQCRDTGIARRQHCGPEGSPPDGESSEQAATNTQSKGGEMSEFNFIQSVRKEIKWEHDNAINTLGEMPSKEKRGLFK